ncbi:hypothetical protein [Paraburkholderia unamae]|uniref:Uncharacterized protein n=1 Tax=Paraburkholderia unamae TaxID=219649 RepID=A0ACC6RXF0_9BURK
MNRKALVVFALMGCVTAIASAQTSSAQPDPSAEGYSRHRPPLPCDGPPPGSPAEGARPESGKPPSPPDSPRNAGRSDGPPPDLAARCGAQEGKPQ